MSVKIRTQTIENKNRLTWKKKVINSIFSKLLGSSFDIDHFAWILAGIPNEVIDVR